MVSIVIPVRKGDDPTITLKSLSVQTYTDFEVCIFWHNTEVDKSVGYARNQGYKLSSRKYILFSDADIAWRPDALERLVRALDDDYGVAFVYGSYLMGGKLYCALPYSIDKLKELNYISTMSLIRRECCLEWDEDLFRLCDWALWLKMMKAGFTGKYIGGSEIFSTEVRNGITFNGTESWETAYQKVKVKYGL